MIIVVSENYPAIPYVLARAQYNGSVTAALHFGEPSLEKGHKQLKTIVQP
jgi:hypothetical protein